MLLEPALIEFIISRQPAERPNETELSGDDVDYETELRILRELEAALRLPVHFVESLSRGQQMGDKDAAAVGRISKIVGFLREVESPPDHGTARRQVLRPGSKAVAELDVYAGPEAIEAKPLHEIEAELPETESRRVIAKMRAKNGP